MTKRGPRNLAKKNIPQLKATLDIVFALWVKLNWCYPEATEAHCYTCDKLLTLGTVECQAGHFISRAYSPTRYDENNVRIQCSGCNLHGNGKPIEFERNLRLEVGDDVIDGLKERAIQPWKWNRDYLIEKIIYYREEIKNYDT